MLADLLGADAAAFCSMSPSDALLDLFFATPSQKLSYPVPTFSYETWPNPPSPTLPPSYAPFAPHALHLPWPAELLIDQRELFNLSEYTAFLHHCLVLSLTVSPRPTPRNGSRDGVRPVSRDGQTRSHQWMTPRVKAEGEYIFECCVYKVLVFERSRTRCFSAKGLSFQLQTVVFLLCC